MPIFVFLITFIEFKITKKTYKLLLNNNLKLILIVI